MIKVLFFELSFEFGGIESFLLNLVQNTELKKGEYKFDFVSSANKPAGYDAFVSAGVNVIKISSKKNIIAYARDLDRIFRREKYDVVHIQKNSLTNALPIKYAKKHHVPYIIHAQNSASSKKSIFTELIHNFNKDRYENDAFKKLACGLQAAKWMFSNLDDVVYIQNGVNPNEFRMNLENRNNLRKKNNLDNHLIVCHVGRFSKNKNHKFIIDVFIELRKLFPQCELFLVGDGQEFETIKEYVKEKDIDTEVVFWGSLNRERESIVLQSSDIFILPSLYEGVSIASIEAQIAGLWLIVSDTVDKEINISGNVMFKSLGEGAKAWACFIKENYVKKEYDYESLVHDLRIHGYDMKYTTENLLDMYRDAKELQ